MSVYMFVCVFMHIRYVCIYIYILPSDGIAKIYLWKSSYSWFEGICFQELGILNYSEL